MEQERRIAEETLLDSLDEAIDSAAKKMSKRELKKANKEFNDVVDRAVSAHSQRRDRIKDAMN